MTETEIIELLRSYENDQNGCNFIGADSYEEIAKEIIIRFTESSKAE